MFGGGYFLWRTLPDGRRRVGWRAWVLVWVTPVLFLAAGLGMLAIEGWRHMVSVPTEAEVVRVYEWQGSIVAANDTLYGPVFRYVWSDGQPTEATSGTSHARRFEVGERMTIRFMPSVKTDVILPGGHNWHPGLIVGGIGLALTFPALLGTRGIRRWIAGGTAA